MSDVGPSLLSNESSVVENANANSPRTSKNENSLPLSGSSPTKAKWVPKKIATPQFTEDEVVNNSESSFLESIPIPKEEPSLIQSLPEVKPPSLKWLPSKLLNLQTHKSVSSNHTQPLAVNSLYDDIKPSEDTNLPTSLTFPLPPEPKNEASSLPAKAVLTSFTLSPKPTIQITLKKPSTSPLSTAKPSGNTFAPIEIKLSTTAKKMFSNPFKPTPKITILPPKVNSSSGTDTQLQPAEEPTVEKDKGAGSSSNVMCGKKEELLTSLDNEKISEKQMKSTKHHEEKKTEKKRDKGKEGGSAKEALRSRSKTPLTNKPKERHRRSHDQDHLHTSASLLPPVYLKPPVSDDPRRFAAHSSTIVGNAEPGLCFYPIECVKYTQTMPSLVYCPNSQTCKRLLEEAAKLKAVLSASLSPQVEEKLEKPPERKRGLELPLSPLQPAATDAKKAKYSPSSVLSPTLMPQGETPPTIPLTVPPPNTVNIAASLDDVYEDFLKSVQHPATKTRRSRSHSPGWSSDSQRGTPSPEPFLKEPSPVVEISPSKVVALKLPTKKISRISLPLFAEDDEEVVKKETEKDQKDKSPVREDVLVVPSESCTELSKIIIKEEELEKVKKETREEPVVGKRNSKSSERSSKRSSSRRSRTPDQRKHDHNKDSRPSSRNSGSRRGSGTHDPRNRDPRRMHRAYSPRDQRRNHAGSQRGRESRYDNNRHGRRDRERSDREKERADSKWGASPRRTRRSRSPISAAHKPQSPKALGSPLGTIELKLNNMSPKQTEDWEDQQTPQRPKASNRSWSSSDSEGSPPPSKLKSQRSLMLDHPKRASSPSMTPPRPRGVSTSSPGEEAEKKIKNGEANPAFALGEEETREQVEPKSPVRLSLDERLQLELGMDQKEEEQPAYEPRMPWHPRPGSMKLVQVGNTYQIVPAGGPVTERGPYGPGNLPILRPGVMLPTVPILPPIRYPPVHQGFPVPLADPRVTPSGMIPPGMPAPSPVPSPMFTPKTTGTEDISGIPNVTGTGVPNPGVQTPSPAKKVEEVVNDLDEEDQILVMEAMSYVPKEEPTSPVSSVKKEKRSHKPVARIPIRPPPDKGILVLPGSRVNGNAEEVTEKRKGVVFADKVRPGDGTSPSGGEEITSPLPFMQLPKEKRLIKKRKKMKPAEGDVDYDSLPPPPPPPGSPPPHLRNLIYVDGVVYIISTPGQNAAPEEYHSPSNVPPPLAPLPSPLELQAELLPTPALASGVAPAVNQTRVPIASPVYDSPPPGVSPPR